ncbi:MAG TPA: hypothetical protein VHE37_06995 [Nevskiaceae bacterium]|nr:hypothetical protein [Nevskiaceae bacterium]
MLADYNHARFDPASAAGHYESFFVRANHPSRPLAFWIRYTVFAPRGRPQDAIGELWAVVSDGESGKIAVAKQELPIARCEFARDRFFSRVGDAVQQDGRVQGQAGDIRWQLIYEGAGAPLLMLPEQLYAAKLPRAKTLTGAPMAVFTGTLAVGGNTIAVDGWRGSQNHNWGSRHTDRYAYGQVCGFDNAPDSFLELASARLKFGPLWTPLMTPLVLRHAGREHALNGIGRSLRARARFEYFEWTFSGEGDGVGIDGWMRARREDFAGLRYYNPPGGAKYCLNSKIADCDLTLRHADGRIETLVASRRAAFEILTDDLQHGVPIMA